MAIPRATSTYTDELGATLSGMKSRINELETASGSGDVPIGSIMDYIGTTAPGGWTVLDGGTIVNGQYLYPNLWSILPSTFKSGTNIIKPDTRGRVLVHQSTSGTLSGTIGTTGGNETVTLTTAQMPVHGHGMNHDHMTANRSYNVSAGAGGTALAVVGNAANSYTLGNPVDPNNLNLDKLSTDDAGGSGGATQPHQNLQPYMIVVKILKLV